MLGLKDIRLPGYDYRSDGYFFVTLCSRQRYRIFEGHEEIIEQIFREVVQSLSGVRIDTIIVMPDHVHLLYHFKNSSHGLGEVVRRCKAKTSYVLGGRAWQPNYYELIVRDEESLNKIREYISMNRELTDWREEIAKVLADKSASYRIQ